MPMIKIIQLQPNQLINHLQLLSWLNLLYLFIFNQQPMIFYRFSFLARVNLHHNHLLQFYSTHNQNPKSDYNNEKMQRLRQIQYRQKMIQDNKIREMNSKIERTQGTFNPIREYFKLFRYQIVFIVIFGIALAFSFIVYRTSGIYIDPFTKKKKLILINTQFQKSLNVDLKNTIHQNFNSVQVSSKIKKQCKELQSYISKITKRTYKISLIQSDQQVAIVLPETIVLSTNLLLDKGESKNIENLLLLLQTLFIKQSHIKNLQFSYIFTFLRYKYFANNLSDINMIKIYTKKYKKIEIQQVFAEIQKFYGIKKEDLRQSIMTIINKDKNINRISPFSLRARLQVNHPSLN